MKKIPKAARILIVDDHPMIREGVTLGISAQHDMQVCGEAATEEEALAVAEKTSPDLMIVDVSLKTGDGIELVKQIKAKHPEIKVIVFSAYDESLYAERALRAGASGYVNKQESQDKLLDAIRTALAGKRYVSSEVAQRLLAQVVGGKSETKSPIEQLTDRELGIFRMIGKGMPTSKIANELFLSTHTIDSHREHIKRKLGIKNAAELSREAVQWVLENG